MVSEAKSVRQIVEMARHYIQETFTDDPGFKGAFIIGSINSMSPDAPFPEYRDIDIGVITDSVEERQNTEKNVNGYIVEVIRSNPSLFSDAEKILSNCMHADNIAADSILLDPYGFLNELHQKVKAEFSRRKWVQARCEQEMKYVFENLNGMKEAKGIGDYMFNFGRYTMFTAGTLTAIHQFPPTHRRGDIQLRNILHTAGEDELFESYLRTVGSHDITQTQAEQFLADAVCAFDRAVEIFKTPIPYAYKLEPFIRPYLLEGTKEIFHEGGYRESIFWIARFFVIASMVIQTDGTEAEKPAAMAKMGQFLHALGIDSEQGRTERTKACEVFYPQLCDYVKKTLMTSPDITD
ncbi:MAG: hypothetical protein PHZ02_09295 [Desulfocapsaceae bacterium]|nr:hypothetical protein [Desulfocapsaceae bacterium]